MIRLVHIHCIQIFVFLILFATDFYQCIHFAKKTKNVKLDNAKIFISDKTFKKNIFQTGYGIYNNLKIRS